MPNFSRRFRADCVERVGNQRRRRDHRDHLVEQVRRVVAEDRPVVGRRVGQQRQLVPPLAQGDEQREQRRAHQQPMADGHGDRRRAGRRPQREARGDRQHVENDDVLQERRVGDQQHEIRRGRLKERPAQSPTPRSSPPRRRSRAAASASVGLERARRDRPMRFQRMAPILFAIEHVVDEVDRRRRARRTRRRRRRPSARRRVIAEPLRRTPGPQRRRDSSSIDPGAMRSGD